MSIQGGPAAEPLRQADQALRRGDTGEALRLLRGAEAANPADAGVKLQIALALRMRGDLPGALAAIDAALAIEPYLLMAHLSKAFVLEKLGRAREAVAGFAVEGPKVNLPFFTELLANEEFVSGSYDTGLVERMRAKK